MAYENSSAALPAPAHPTAHPMAKPGYGKRSAPDQTPSRLGDFDHLSGREAYLAAFLDRLCENAAMDAKTIAKAQPLYGQQAVRSGLNELSKAGHLRRVRRRSEVGQLDGETCTRWVFHTYWSRTARSNEWWATFLAGDVPPETSTAAPQPSASQVASGDVAHPPEASHSGTRQPSPEPPLRPGPPLRPEPSVRPEVGPRRSAAYDALAQLGLSDARLVLSAADCAALEEPAAEWLVRGTAVEHLAQALLAGLPKQVHSPRAFVQRRLRDKMPPERPAVVPPRVARTLMECTDCGVPGRPEALPGGLCRACRAGDGGVSEPHLRQSVVLADSDVRRHAAHMRGILAARHDTPQPQPHPAARPQPHPQHLA
ncbi:hypothetical protein [Streptomyces umbrinus]|uniref:hypothetical protein n=1 Tax=Streptomyces umbrinus TaxID=67370 RepID=UPI00342B947B